jgi:hypothetical protein
MNPRLGSIGCQIVLDPTIQSRYITHPTVRTLALQMFRYGRFMPSTSVRIGRLVSWRQAVPPTFVAIICLSAILGLLMPAALLIGAAALFTHVAVGTSVALGAPATLPVAARIQLPLVLVIIRVSYSSGYLLGMLAVARGRMNAA